MMIQVIGAGLPRTGTSSLREALALLFDGQCLHMSAIPGHPFDLGADWEPILAGNGTPHDWHNILAGYVAAVDWPASLFWRELSAIYPDALVLLSVRDTARGWWESAEETIIPVARKSLAAEWSGGDDFLAMLERFTGTAQWDDPATLMAAYEQHNAAVQETIPSQRLLEWQAKEGWEPICTALGKSVPNRPFPWRNRREDWR